MFHAGVCVTLFIRKVTEYKIRYLDISVRVITAINLRNINPRLRYAHL